VKPQRNRTSSGVGLKSDANFRLSLLMVKIFRTSWFQFEDIISLHRRDWSCIILSGMASWSRGFGVFDGNGGQGF
jgi:hypothetical protein